MFEVLKKYLQCQTLIWPIVLSAILSSLSNYISNYVLIVYLNKSFSNCAYSYVISQWIAFLSLSIIIIIRKRIHYTQQNLEYREPQDKFHENGYSKIDWSSDMDESRYNNQSLVDESTHSTAGLIRSSASGSVTSDDLSAHEINNEDDPEDNWPPLSCGIFSGWKVILSLGIPGAISLGIEWYV